MPDNELKIDISEVYRLLCGVGEVPPDAMAELQSAAAAVLLAATPRVVSRRCRIIRENDSLSLEGTGLFLPGECIKALLSDCEECFIFCATLGAQVDLAIRRAQIKDVATAAALDAAASVSAESLCNAANAEIAQEISAEGKYLTDRFSPGYGDLPLNIQKNFCAVLDATRRIGVTVGEDFMMTPMKSVTAIIGISDIEQKSRNTGCTGCIRLPDCRFRERGLTCYGQKI